MSNFIKVVALVSLIISIIPLIIAKNSYTYTSYCLTEYWYADLPTCKLDMKIAISSTIIYFSLTFLVLYLLSIIAMKIKKIIDKPSP